MGLDKPVINCFETLNPVKFGSCAVNPLDTQFFIYIGNLLRGELGISYHLAYPRGGALWGMRGARALIGIVVLPPPWLAVLYLRSRPTGEFLVLLAIALIAFVDIGAYFAGRAIGGPKLMPRVSPAKTWAGLGGGLLASLALALLAAVVSGVPLPRLPAWLGWCVATALASVVGDLLESMVKRQSGIKDSGSLLPGHGGLFDRLDSLTAGLPVFALGVLVSGGFWS